MDKGEAEADMARDEEVKGEDREAAIDVMLNADITDDLTWND